MSYLDPQTIIRTGGLALIAIIIFAESGLLIGFFLPGDSLLFTAGFLASQHVVGLDIWVLSGVCAVAAALGPLVGYWYGHWWGPRLFSREDSLLFRKQHLIRAHEFYERHGGKALVITRFMPVVRTFAPVVAGMASMEYARFGIYTIVGAVLWAVGMSWLGYFLGSVIPDAGKYLEYIVALIVVVSIAPPIIHLLRERQKSKAPVASISSRNAAGSRRTAYSAYAAVSPLTGLLVVLALIAINGFFVATEFALVSSRAARIDQLAAAGNRAARIVQSAKANPNRFISGTQLGVTVANLLLGWIGENTFAQLLQPVLDGVVVLAGRLPAPAGDISGPAHAIATVLALVCITFLQVTLGEQVPKILALQRAESFILFAVQPVSALAWVFRPFISLLYVFTNLVLRLIGVTYDGEEHAVHSPEELQLLVSQSARAGLMTGPERELVQRAFDFSDQTAGEMMVPRTEIIALPVDSTVQDALRVAQRYRHSRFPVYEKTIDNVIGILSTKDLLSVAARRGARSPLNDVTLRRLIRPPLVVPQGALLIEVLARMKAARQPMVVVLDEFGGTAGIVTLKDLVARLLGDVGDEYTPASQEVRTLADGTIVADGLALVEDVNAQLGTHFDASEVDSLGGLVFSRLGRRPRVGDEVDVGSNYRARVERLDGLRVARVRLIPPHSQPTVTEPPAPPNGVHTNGTATDEL